MKTFFGRLWVTCSRPRTFFSGWVVLNDLPKFRGAPRANETDTFVEGIDVRTFFRSLENHFSHHNITTDEAKLRIVFNQIDKDTGNAIDLITCYAGRDVEYEDVREEFLEMYPALGRTEFRYAAKSLLATNVTKPTHFCGMTRLETHTRALTEAYYLCNSNLEEISVTQTSAIAIGGADDDNLLLSDLVHTLMMHLILADQLENKLYDKVKAVTPLTSSTRFMTKVVHEAAKTAQIQKDQRRSSRPTEPNEVLYNMKSRSENPKAGVNKAAHIVCFNCSKTGHYQRLQGR